MKFTFIFLNMLLLFILFSCSKQSQPSRSENEEALGLDCDKLKNYEDVKNIMDLTSRERLTNLELVKRNIIGEWGLIGVQPAWIPLEPGSECIHLTISDTTIILKDLDSGEESTIAYEITRYPENSFGTFFLSSKEDDPEYPLGNYKIEMSEFSENYMFGSGSGKYADGTIYIYEKLL